MSVPAVQETGYDLSSIGLRLKDPDLPLEDFTHICWMLGRFHEAVRFAIGDALIQGEALYGQLAFQAFEALQLSEEGRTEYRRVAEAVPISVRRKGLSWSHHRAVAALKKPGPDGFPVPDREAQKRWLKRAADEGLSHHALRDELRNGAEPKSLTVCRCCGKRL